MVLTLFAQMDLCTSFTDRSSIVLECVCPQPRGACLSGNIQKRTRNSFVGSKTRQSARDTRGRLRIVMPSLKAETTRVTCVWSRRELFLALNSYRWASWCSGRSVMARLLQDHVN